jgi:hypothetical protein
MNYRGRIKRLEVEARRRSLARERRPLYFSRGGLSGGGDLDLSELKKSLSVYRKATREDKP